MASIVSAFPTLPGKVLFISHEASRTGAPMVLLHFLRWLKNETSQAFDILVRQDGPLTADFRELAPVLSPIDFEQSPARFRDYALIYSNTICNGHFLAPFALGNMPVVTHVHELDFAVDVLGPRNFAEILRHTGHFIACAQAVGGQLQRRFNLPSATIGIHYEMFDPLRVDANVAALSSAQVRASLGLPLTGRVVAACGTLDYRKGGDLFVQMAVRMARAWRNADPLHFIWVGHPTESILQQNLRQDLRRAGLVDRVIFAGEQSNPHAFLAQADVFCLTSREDPFPLVMLEAMALGKPLLCFSGAGGAEELCARGVGQSIPYLDVAAMADQCMKFLMEPSTAYAAGQEGAKVVRRDFVPGTVAPALWQDVFDFFMRFDQVAAMGRWNRSVVEIYREWPDIERPQAPYVATVLQRAELRANARRLQANGRSRDAAALLMRSVTHILGSKDLRGIVETLIEFGGALKGLDAEKAAYLFQQAEHLLRNFPSASGLQTLYRHDLAQARSSPQRNYP